MGWVCSPWSKRWFPGAGGCRRRLSLHSWGRSSEEPDSASGWRLLGCLRDGRDGACAPLGNASSPAQRENGEGPVPEQIKTYRWFRLASLFASIQGRNSFCSLLSGPLLLPRRHLPGISLGFGYPAVTVCACLVAFLATLSWMRGREMNPLPFIPLVFCSQACLVRDSPRVAGVCLPKSGAVLKRDFS